MYMFNSPEGNNAQVQIPPRCWIWSLIVDQPERQVVFPLRLSHGWKFAKSRCWIFPDLLLEVRNHFKMLDKIISRHCRFSSHYFRCSCLLGLLYFCNMNFYILVISNFAFLISRRRRLSVHCFRHSCLLFRPPVCVSLRAAAFSNCGNVWTHDCRRSANKVNQEPSIDILIKNIWFNFECCSVPLCVFTCCGFLLHYIT